MGTNYFVFVSLSLLHYFSNTFSGPARIFERGSFNSSIFTTRFINYFQGPIQNFPDEVYQDQMWEVPIYYLAKFLQKWKKLDWGDGNGNWIILEMKIYQNLTKIQTFSAQNSQFMLHKSKLTSLSLLLSLGVKVILYHLKWQVSFLHGNLVKSRYSTESAHYRCQH